MKLAPKNQSYDFSCLLWFWRVSMTFFHLISSTSILRVSCLEKLLERKILLSELLFFIYFLLLRESMEKNKTGAQCFMTFFIEVSCSILVS